MSIALGIAIFITLWWVVLFAVLPFGVRSSSETGEAMVAGADPGAPAQPLLLRKFIWTTIIATAIFAVFWASLPLWS